MTASSQQAKQSKAALLLGCNITIIRSHSCSSCCSFSDFYRTPDTAAILKKRSPNHCQEVRDRFPRSGKSEEAAGNRKSN